MWERIWVEAKVFKKNNRIGDVQCLSQRDTKSGEMPVQASLLR